MPSNYVVSNERKFGYDHKKILNFKEHVASDIHIQMILQDHPASVITMSSELISEISHAVDIQCIKEESVPTFNKIINIKKLTNNKVKVLLTCALYGWFDLMSQSDGFNTGFVFQNISGCTISKNNNLKKHLIFIRNIYQ